MKAQLLMLSAAALLAGAATAAKAGPAEVRLYLDQAKARADAQLAAAGVSLPGDLAVTLTVGGDGRLTGARVSHTSGSLEADQGAAAALRRLYVPDAPAELAGRKVTLTLSPAPIRQAKAP